MSSEKSLTPQIRFKDFTEAWEQRKLSDIATKQTSKNTDSTILEPFTNSAEQGVISQYDYFDHGITNVANISNYFVICPNDFVYNPRISVTAPCGPINRNRLNRPGIMSPLYTIFRTNQSIDVTYLEYYFKTKKWHPFMFLEGNTGARSDRFSISDSTFFKLPIQIPSKAEQKLISKQLEALSNLIALHQRKLDALKKIKAALLEKMFPKDGSNIPEIRFTGFTEAWEQCKLDDLAIFNPNADLPAQFEYVDLESVAGTEMLSHRTELRDSAPSRAQRLAQFGDLFYQTVRPYQKNNYLYEKPDNNYVFSTGYAQMRPLVDGYFLLSLVQNEGFIKKVLDNCSGTSYPAINANVLSSIVVNSSSHRKEQIQVGCLFRRIDNLITLHQRKLDALKKIKSALLEKMFV